MPLSQASELHPLTYRLQQFSPGQQGLAFEKLHPHTWICFTFHPQHLSSSSCLKRMLKHLSAVLPEDPGSVSSTHMVVYSHPMLGDPMFSPGTCTHAVHVLGQNIRRHLKKKSSSKFKMCSKKMTKQCLWSIVPD